MPARSLAVEYLQEQVIDGRSTAVRPLEEIVNNVLLLPEPQVLVMRLHLERAAEERSAPSVAWRRQLGLTRRLLLLLLLPLEQLLCPLAQRSTSAAATGSVPGGRRQNGHIICVLGVLAHGGQLLGLGGAPEAAAEGGDLAWPPAARRGGCGGRGRSRLARIAFAGLKLAQLEQVVERVPNLIFAPKLSASLLVFCVRGRRSCSGGQFWGRVESSRVKLDVLVGVGVGVQLSQVQSVGRPVFQCPRGRRVCVFPANFRCFMANRWSEKLCVAFFLVGNLILCCQIFSLSRSPSSKVSKKGGKFELPARVTKRVGTLGNWSFFSRSPPARDSSLAAQRIVRLAKI